MTTLPEGTRGAQRGYHEFLASKAWHDAPTGIEPPADLGPHLFPFQQDLVRWALRRGRAALFAQTGLGKTRMQLAWAQHVHERTGRDVLILCPLAVAPQTVEEGAAIGIAVNLAREQAHVRPGISIANYESLHKLTPEAFGAIVLDESARIKAFAGKTRHAITAAFASTPFKLACTATPAPNDLMELGMQSEFIGSMRSNEMLGAFFDRTADDLANYYLKPHARKAFYSWLCSWAAVVQHPRDLGYTEASGFDLPPLHVVKHEVGAGTDIAREAGTLFNMGADDLASQRAARRSSMDGRVAKVAELVNDSSDPWVVWCDLNDESEALAAAIPGAVEVRGSQTDDEKEAALMAFAGGAARVIVTKSRIAGWGLNWQHCAHQAFCGLGHSYEGYYQSVRRSWRFGQKRPVTVHIVTSDAERSVVENVERKEREAARMFEDMGSYTQEEVRRNVKGQTRDIMADQHEVARDSAGAWELHLGDSCTRMREMPDGAADISVFSPPFLSLFHYTNSERDFSNCRTKAQFFEQFAFLIRELRRVLKPGRIACVHCQNLRTFKGRDGVHGFYDFRGDIIRAFVAEGWAYHSEVVIQKSPVDQMYRTKAHGLLYVNLRKDSTISQQGLPDTLVMFRAPGDNEVPVTKTHESFPLERWQRYADPVWFDIDEMDVLNVRTAKGPEDTKHLCPLQLTVIRRCVELWSNPGEVVFSPFAGVGSEGVAALEEGRRFLGCELKPEYFKQAIKNLRGAGKQRGLFDAVDAAAPEDTTTPSTATR